MLKKVTMAAGHSAIQAVTHEEQQEPGTRRVALRPLMEITIESPKLSGGQDALFTNDELIAANTASVFLEMRLVLRLCIRSSGTRTRHHNCPEHETSRTTDSSTIAARGIAALSGRK